MFVFKCLKPVGDFASIGNRAFECLFGVVDIECDVLDAITKLAEFFLRWVVGDQRCFEDQTNVALLEEVAGHAATASGQVVHLRDSEAKGRGIEHSGLLCITNAEAHMIHVNQVQGIGGIGSLVRRAG